MPAALTTQINASLRRRPARYTFGCLSPAARGETGACPIGSGR